MRRSPLIFVLLCAGAALVGAGWSTARVATSARRQADEIALSPEEAVIAIKPLQLTQDDLPPGYSRGALTVDTPVSDAVRKAATGAAPYAALEQSAAEGTQACSVQSLAPPTGAPLTTATVNICLMSDAVSAQSFAQGQARAIDPGTATLSAETAPTDLRLGDGQPTIWRLQGADPNGRPSTDFLVRWSRGQVAFELRGRAAVGKEDPAGAADLSRAVDTGEATRPAASLPPATIAAPVSEAQRLYATLNSQTAIVPVSQPPSATSRLLSNLIQLPAEAVLNANNPVATLRLLDGTFRRVVYANEVFRTADRTTLHGQRVTVDADAAGAASELRNPSSDGFFTANDANDQPLPNDVQTDSELTPPLQLGDGTRALKTVIAYPDARNNFVTYTLRWTHGAIVLQARIGQSERRNQPLSDLVPWAQQVEAAYQASALAAAQLFSAHAPSEPRMAATQARGAAMSDALAFTAPTPVRRQRRWLQRTVFSERSGAWRATKRCSGRRTAASAISR